MAAEGESLESFLNKATNPSVQNEDWEAIMAFCDQINKELEGPQIAVRLLSHKIQSPQEREALYALITLESCVKNCGHRFHQEIGKFRFLNEVIKVVSPKYLGNYTTEKVKKKCIEMMYSWSENLKHEPKIVEAYTMLKKQGIVTEDPTYIDQTFEPPPLPREKDSIFDDEDKSKQLARLLKSKNPEDLQAANRLIKNMVKQDMERIEKESKRTHELETVNNNVKLLNEMLQHYTPGNSTESDQEILKELYQSLEKRRPNLFRLASDTDDSENDAMSDILKTNDEVVRVMTLYNKQVEGKTEENGLISLSENNAQDEGDLSTLLGTDLDLISDPQTRSNAFSNCHSLLDDHQISFNQSLIDDPLASLGSNSGPAKSDMEELDNIFGATSQTNRTDQQADLGLLDLNLPSSQPQSTFQANNLSQQINQQPSLVPQLQPVGGAGISQITTTQSQFLQPVTSGPYAALSSQSDVVTGKGLDLMTMTSLMPGRTGLGILAPAPANNTDKHQQPLLPTNTGKRTQVAPPNQSKSAAGMNELDVLGQSLLKQSLGNKPSHVQSSPAIKLPLNQILTSAQQQQQQQQQQNLPNPLLSSASPVTSPAVSTTGSPAKSANVVVEALTNVHVALESVQPGSAQPLTAYDKNNIKVVIHFGKDKPRADVMVMVVSTMSTNTSPVKKFQFQAAVPKVMKVKLQTPSATDLPGYNPILPPAAITQVMLIANPQKENIKLKFKVTCTLDDKQLSDVGDVENFPIL